MKNIILLACIVLCTLNYSYGQNEYELSLIGEWELYSVLVENSKSTSSGSIHLKDIYDESKPVVCIFKSDKTYQMKSNDDILEEGSWSISNNGKKITICRIDEAGGKNCESRKLNNNKHDYRDREFDWFGENSLLVDKKLEDSSWSQSTFKRKKENPLVSKDDK